jgi:hypothetical protein
MNLVKTKWQSKITIVNGVNIHRLYKINGRVHLIIYVGQSKQFKSHFSDTETSAFQTYKHGSQVSVH